MVTFACTRLGLDCDFKAEGDSRDAVRGKAMEHGMAAHSELMANMTAEQSAEFAKALEAAIQNA